MRVQVAFLWVVTLLSAGAAQAEVNTVRAYVWGNSLINHATGNEDTAVPHWLALLARAGGKELAISGESAFGIQFPERVPPTPNWSFEAAISSWSPGNGSFADAGIDTIVINPENFIQYRAPDLPYEGEARDDRTPVSGAVALLDWVQDQGVRPTVFLYEGWAEMDSFPPTRRSYGRYLRYTLNQYHVWYRAWRELVAVEVPDLDVRLIPVGSVLSKLIDDGPLSDLRPTDFYSDNAPHGTPTTYLLAAMVTYAALYDAPPPEGFDAFEGVHKDLAESYPEVAAFIWQEVMDYTGPRRALAPVPAAVTDQAAGGETMPEETIAAMAQPATTRTVSWDVPAPEAANATGLANPSLAMGLNGIADWSTQHPFIDIMKTARPWIGHKPGQWGGWSDDDLAAGGYLDESGWVKAIPEGVDRIETFVLTDQPKEATGLNARYRMTWTGTGDIDVIGRARVLRRSRDENAILFSFTPGDTSVAVVLHDTDPEGSGDYIRNISIVREDHVPLFEAGAVFNPDFLARIRDLRSLRFMDWMYTNNSKVTRWDQRAQVGDFTYAWRGVPLETMVQLSNLVGADPWFNMPHKADDDYVRRFAAVVEATLDSRLMTYVEWSNEVWNRVFEQSAWIEAQARDRWGKAAEADGWMQFAGLRAAEVADIWAEVYGPTAKARLMPVIAVHTGWPGLEEPMLEAPLWQAEGARPPADRFRAYAVTGYFGHQMGSEQLAPVVQAMISEAEDKARASGTVQGLQRVALREFVKQHRFETAIAPVIEMLRKGSVEALLTELWPYHADMARAHGMALVMYEGGTHVAGHGEFQNDEKLTAFFHELNYSPDMGEIYAELLTAWRDVGGTMFNAFVDVVNPTKFGSWGNLRHLDDKTPRWDVLSDFNRDKPGWWEERRGDAFLHGVVRFGTEGDDRLEGTSEEDMMAGLEGDDTLVSHGRGDMLNGGPGQDIAILSGAYAEYGFEAAGGQIIAWHPLGQVTLRDIELVRFGDGVEVRAELLH